MHSQYTNSECLRSSASCSPFFLPHPPHSWCGDLCTRRLEVGRAVDLRKARLQTPPPAGRGGHELRGPWRTGTSMGGGTGWPRARPQTHAQEQGSSLAHGICRTRMETMLALPMQKHMFLLSPCFARTHTWLIWFLNVLSNKQFSSLFLLFVVRYQRCGRAINDHRN